MSIKRDSPRMAKSDPCPRSHREGKYFGVKGHHPEAGAAPNFWITPNSTADSKHASAQPRPHTGQRWGRDAQRAASIQLFPAARQGSLSADTPGLGPQDAGASLSPVPGPIPSSTPLHCSEPLTILASVPGPLEAGGQHGLGVRSSPHQHRSSVSTATPPPASSVRKKSAPEGNRYDSVYWFRTASAVARGK